MRTGWNDVSLSRQVSSIPVYVLSGSIPGPICGRLLVISTMHHVQLSPVLKREGSEAGRLSFPLALCDVV